MGKVVEYALFAMNNIACDEKYSETIIQFEYLNILTKIVDLNTLKVKVIRLIAWGLSWMSTYDLEDNDVSLIIEHWSKLIHVKDTLIFKDILYWINGLLEK